MYVCTYMTYISIYTQRNASPGILRRRAAHQADGAGATPHTLYPIPYTLNPSAPDHCFVEKLVVWSTVLH